MFVEPPWPKMGSKEAIKKNFQQLSKEYLIYKTF